MKYVFCALALASWLVVPSVASAVSISGIVLYTTNDFGDPNGYLTYDGQLQAQLWRTMVGGEWHILGVWAGVPPQSLGPPPLNSPDAMVEIPLIEGENDFTLLGQPGSNTRVDEYDRFCINLYFDGMLDHPGISVLFPKNNTPAGSPTTPNRSERIYSLGLTQVQVAPQATYDDGVDTVSVPAVSFLAPETFNTNVDLVSAQRLVPSGPSDPNASDFIGVLKVMVQPSASQGGEPVAGVGVPGAGIIPHGIADSGTLHGPDIPIAGAQPRIADTTAGLADRGAAVTDGHGAKGSDVVMAAGSAEPTAAAAETTTPGGTPTPAKTPSPHATTGTVSPTVGVGATRTPAASRSPAATGMTATPAPRVSSSTTPAGTPTARSRSR